MRTKQEPFSHLFLSFSLFSADGAQRETSSKTQQQLQSPAASNQPALAAAVPANDLNKLTTNVDLVSKGSGSHQIDLDAINRNGPYFDKAASKNVTALLGKTVYLTCRVKNLGNKTVSN